MKRKSRNSSKTQNFDVVVNGGQVEVRATPYLVNQEEMRFRVSYNDSPVYIFAWDKEHRGLTVVDDRSIPKPVEQAIARQLEARMAA